MTDEYLAVALRQAWERLKTLSAEAEANGFSLVISNEKERGGPGWYIGERMFYEKPTNLTLSISKTLKF